MKKYYLILSLLFGFTTFVKAVPPPVILTMDTNDKSIYTTSIIITNSSVITSTNSVSYNAVIGVTNTVGAADAGKVVKLNDSGLIMTNMLSSTWGSFPFSQSFTSTNLAITAGGTLNVAHGLSSAPTLVFARLKNVSGELNYTVGDEVAITLGQMDSSGTGNFGMSVICGDSANLVIRFGSSANAMRLLDKTTGAPTTITAANWKLILSAWK